MTAPRCANCGGLLAPDAEWCGQCFAKVEGPEPRTDRANGAAESPPTESSPTERPSEAPGSEDEPRARPLETPPDAVVMPMRPSRRTSSAAGTGVRSRGEDVVWECPTCGTESPIDVETCPVCGTSFSRLLQDPDATPQVDPDRAVRASLLFPGAGHYLAGRRADGLARGVVFGFALLTGLFSLVGMIRGGAPTFTALTVLALGGAAGLYALSAMDARRAAERTEPLVSTRALLYGAVGLLLVTLGLLTFAALSATRG